MNIPPDDAGTPPTSPNPGLGFDPNPPGDFSLGKKSSKAPLVVVAVVVLGVVGYFAWSAKKTHEERKIHASVMEHFQGFETDELIKFWGCVLGPNTNGATAPSPDAITMKIDVMFASDFRNYPGKVRDECARLAKDAQGKVGALAALPQYNDALDKYGKAILAMSEALDDWAKVAPEQVQAKMVGKNVEEYATAWHSFPGGTPSMEVIAYDGFLHCAVPDLEKKKDSMDLAKGLFETCKDPAYREKLQNECGKLVTTDKPTQPSKTYKTALQKFSGEDREQQALVDCLKKARKGKLKDNLAPVGMKWVAYREAREGVLKIGQDALKE